MIIALDTLYSLKQGDGPKIKEGWAPSSSGDAVDLLIGGNSVQLQLNSSTFSVNHAINGTSVTLHRSFRDPATLRELAKALNEAANKLEAVHKL